jgi:hypothetical protein
MSCYLAVFPRLLPVQLSSVSLPLDGNESDACSLFFIFSFPPPHEYLTRKSA